jgi:NitT/TauT family transport system permease protein
MSQLQHYLALVAGGLCAAAIAIAWATPIETALLLKAFLALGMLSLIRFFVPLGLWADGALAVVGTVAVLTGLGVFEVTPSFFWLALVAAWLFAWLFVERLSLQLRRGSRSLAWVGLLIPLIFGLALLVMWEVITKGARIPPVLLPAPSAIAAQMVNSAPILWADFVQTFIRSVLPGYAMGCLAGLAVAIAVDRSPFLKAGLLPIGNFMSALPIIGIAPIMVMWFGFDWQSKAAVVVAMTFFPMLVNTVAGLNATSSIERDLMRTYAASYWQTLFKLRLPAAAPFIFNALKINSTLALIGAIVAEFFGTPIVGMGFRISTGVGRLAIDLVWAEIAVAAVAGSVFYGVLALIERGVTFWHPSVRGGRT